MNKTSRIEYVPYSLKVILVYPNGKERLINNIKILDFFYEGDISNGLNKSLLTGYTLTNWSGIDLDEENTAKELDPNKELGAIYFADRLQSGCKLRINFKMKVKEDDELGEINRFNWDYIVTDTYVQYQADNEETRYFSIKANGIPDAFSNIQLKYANVVIDKNLYNNDLSREITAISYEEKVSILKGFFEQ